jgi:hypothetical protein
MKRKKVRVGRGQPKNRDGRRRQIMFCFQIQANAIIIRIE